MELLKIGQISKLVGVSRSTLRYYESLGFIQPALRHDNGYRYYANDAIQRIIFIKKTQSIGFSLAQIESIFSLRKNGHSPCGFVKSILDEKIKSLDAQLNQILQHREDLVGYQAIWRTQLELSVSTPSAATDVICHYIEGIQSPAKAP